MSRRGAEPIQRTQADQPSKHSLQYAPGYGRALTPGHSRTWDKDARPARSRGMRRGGRGLVCPEDAKLATGNGPRRNMPPSRSVPSVRCVPSGVAILFQSPVSVTG